MKKNFVNLYQDAGIIFLSVLVAVILWQTGILLDLLNSVKQVEFVGSFIAGLFFGSFFNSSPDKTSHNISRIITVLSPKELLP